MLCPLCSPDLLLHRRYTQTDVPLASLKRALDTAAAGMPSVPSPVSLPLANPLARDISGRGALNACVQNPYAATYYS